MFRILIEISHPVQLAVAATIATSTFMAVRNSLTGEFGRTPKINTERTGRDHYARALFMLMAIGGIKPGQVLGGKGTRDCGKQL